MTKNEKDLKELEHRVDVLSNLHAKESSDVDYTLSDLQARVRKLEENKQSSSDDKKDIDDIAESLFPFIVKCLFVFGTIVGSFAVLGSIVKDILSLFI